MNYEIKINDFEGPLDLLLHLIKKSNIDIYEINLVDITNQYLEYIKAMENLNLDVASTYLVMAAELIELKSRALLPSQEVIEDEYEEDPKDNLINRLIEYKKYKEVTDSFRNLEERRKEIYTKSPSNYDDYIEGLKIKNTNLSLSDLLLAMSNFLDRKEFEKPLKTTVTNREFSVKERIISIKKLLKEKIKINFIDLFEIKEKSFIVVTFLSILEMAKNDEIEMIQDKNFDNIIISLKGV
ncbi:MAG: segregation/condensation protein A [Bacilli bacterium]|nr:segregation/condensation protein A [Bacilli bacterium]